MSSCDTRTNPVRNGTNGFISNKGGTDHDQKRNFRINWMSTLVTACCLCVLIYLKCVKSNDIFETHEWWGYILLAILFLIIFGLFAVLSLGFECLGEASFEKDVSAGLTD